MKGKLNIYACGGMGTNALSFFLKNGLLDLGEEFSSIKYHTIDTTSKTVDSYPELKDTFYQIKSTLLSSEALDGMAGERKNTTVVKEVLKGVTSFIDANVTSAKGDYHVVIFSGSGGSGSIAGSLLINELIKQDLTVIPVVAGDSSTLFYVNNTINTLASLNGIAKAAKVALPVIYFDNNYDGTATTSAVTAVNNDLLRILKVLALFTSGSVRDIDHQDMYNFLMPSRYTTIEVDPGVYNLTAHIKKLNDPNILLARTLLSSDSPEPIIEINLMQNKEGHVTDTQATKISTELFPLFLTLKKNVLNEEVIRLQARYAELEGLKVVNNETIDGVSGTVDDTGLIL